MLRKLPPTIGGMWYVLKTYHVSNPGPDPSVDPAVSKRERSLIKDVAEELQPYPNGKVKNGPGGHQESNRIDLIDSALATSCA